MSLEEEPTEAEDPASSRESQAAPPLRKGLAGTLVRITVLMAIVEFGVMVALELSYADMNPFEEAALDAVALSVIVGTLAYYWIVRPREVQIQGLFEQLERARRGAEHRARVDVLTSVLTRRAVFDELACEWRRASRSSAPLACLMIDIDHFKSLNDEHGHQAGDTVLEQVARAIRSHCRASDHVGRYGGEEFLVLLPATAHEGAVALAERIRTGVAEVSTHVAGSDISVTVSIGLACRDDEVESAEALLARADRALYLAKNNGRNRLVVAEKT